MQSVRHSSSTLLPGAPFLISILQTIVSSSNGKETCGTLARTAPPSLLQTPERRPTPKLRPQTAGDWELSHPTAAIKLLTGETEPHARSLRLHSILCSHRTLRHRSPNGLFRHFFSGTSHHSICSVACPASDRPITPRRMASSELTEVVCRIRRGRNLLGQRQHFVDV